MNMDEIIKKFETDLDNWLATTEHHCDCNAYFEGQSCCLDRPNPDTDENVPDHHHVISTGTGRKFIRNWLRNNLQ